MRFLSILERALEESNVMSMHQRAKLVPPNATEIGKAETSGGNFLKLLGQRRAPKHRRRKLKGF